MAGKLTKKEAERLMKTDGEARGVTIKTDWTYIKNEKGEEAVKRMEKRMAELGFPLKYDEIEVMDFYPIGMDALSMRVIQELFDFGEEEMVRMGENAIKFSIFLKIILRHFSSLFLLAEEAPKMWKKHYSVGEMEIPDPNPGRKEAVVRIKDFKVDPLYCAVFKGYFSEMMRMSTGQKVRCEETKCMFDGDEYHEFVVRWGEE